MIFSIPDVEPCSEEFFWNILNFNNSDFQLIIFCPHPDIWEMKSAKCGWVRGSWVAVLFVQIGVQFSYIFGLLGNLPREKLTRFRSRAAADERTGHTCLSYQFQLWHFIHVFYIFRLNTAGTYLWHGQCFWSELVRVCKGCFHGFDGFGNDFVNVVIDFLFFIL